jgi:hypothetical protein
LHAQSEALAATSSSDSKILKVSALVGAAAGLLSATALYFYKYYGSNTSSSMSPSDRKALLKRELMNELAKYPI